MSELETRFVRFSCIFAVQGVGLPGSKPRTQEVQTLGMDHTPLRQVDVALTHQLPRLRPRQWFARIDLSCCTVGRSRVHRGTQGYSGVLGGTLGYSRVLLSQKLGLKEPTFNKYDFLRETLFLVHMELSQLLSKQGCFEYKSARL